MKQLETRVTRLEDRTALRPVYVVLRVQGQTDAQAIASSGKVIPESAEIQFVDLKTGVPRT